MPRPLPGTPVLALTITLLLLTSLPCPGQGEAVDAPVDVAPVAERIVERYATALDGVWVGARALEDLGDDGEAWLQAKLGAEDSTVLVQLMVAKALLSQGLGEDVDAPLLAIAENTDHDLDVRIAAIEMLGEFSSARISRFLNGLLDDEAAFHPALRIAAARALFFSDNDYRKSRDSLVPLLESDDPDVRAISAIALGEMGAMNGNVRRILTHLEKEPTGLGARARLILSHDILMRRIERMRETQASGTGGPDNKEAFRKINDLERELANTRRKLDDTSERYRDLQQGMTGERSPLIPDLLSFIERLYVDPSVVDRKELLIAAAKGMVNTLDPFSSFMDPTDTQEFREGISGEYAGIGAHVAKDPETDYLMILRPVYSGPAYEAGLVTDDKIVEVEGLPTKGYTVDDIVERLKGRQGTEVELKVHRRGWAKAQVFHVKRRLIQLESALHTMLPGNIGYVQLTQFGDTAMSEVLVALDDLESHGMKGLILDLRDNPGGYLNTAVGLVDAFVDEMPDPIVTQKDVGDRTRPEAHYPKAGKRGDYPLVVLINEGSASASEIVSGALQDYHRATLVGTRSFGKGSVQRLIDLPDGTNDFLGGTSKLRLTVQYYYLPSGRSIHTRRDREGRIVEKGGVEPDITVEELEIPYWRAAAVEELNSRKIFEEYVTTHFEANADALTRLAEVGDGGQSSGYPDFEEFFSTRNETHALPEDLRRLLRQRIRRRVEDLRGTQFACDYAEDLQLQRGILAVLEKLGADPKGIDEYQGFAQRPVETGPK